MIEKHLLKYLLNLNIVSNIILMTYFVDQKVESFKQPEV